MPKARMKKSRAQVTPMKFVSDLWSARAALTIVAAVELDVFTAIAEGNKTAAAVAKAIKASKRGIEGLLDALVALGYLTKRGEQFSLAPVSDTFLVRTKPSYIGAMADETRITLPSWMQITDVIRTGKPVSGVDTAEGREFFPRLVRAIFP